MIRMQEKASLDIVKGKQLCLLLVMSILFKISLIVL
jgi:hypothetical protein